MVEDIHWAIYASAPSPYSQEIKYYHPPNKAMVARRNEVNEGSGYEKLVKSLIDRIDLNHNLLHRM